MKSLRIIPLLALLILFLSNCSIKPERTTSEKFNESDYTSITYLALGDSYTIGESVSKKGRWPVQLSDSLLKSKQISADVTIVAKTGWTTAELQHGIDSTELNTSYDLVSLLIGVNNQYRGYDIEIYKTEFRELLEEAIEFAGGEASRVFVVSIPNYGVTPFGLKNEDKIRQELLVYDDIAQSIASEYDIPFVNITPISEGAKKDVALIAEDQLHPSDKMYSLWVKEILPTVVQLLEQ